MDIPSTNPSTITRIQHPGTLRVARYFVAFVAIASVITFIASVFIMVNATQNPIPTIREGLDRLGLAPSIYVLISVGLPTLFGLLSMGVAFLILLRRSDDRMGLVMATFLLSLGGSYVLTNLPAKQWGPVNPLLFAIMLIPGWLGWGLITLVFAMFPDGKIVFRWLYVLIAFQLVLSALWNFMPGDSPLNPTNWFEPVVGLVLGLQIVGVVYALIWKYRHTLTPAERQQTKWPLIGIVVAFTLNNTSSFTSVLFPQVLTDPAAITLNNLYTTFTYFALILIPLTLAFAILRYRLWDIDLLVNRSLVYSAATLLILVVFFGITFVLQAILGNQQVIVALIISGVIAALAFNPVRKIMQHLVDRYIYRLNFDLDQLSIAQKPLEIKNPGLLSGKTVGGYHVLGLLGKGGMGEVYKGQRDSQTVALKILPDELERQEEYRKRFQREAQSLSQLDHPHIVKYYGVGASEGVAYIALEYIDGQNLSEYLQHRGKLALTEAQGLFSDCASALDYAHQLGFVHRDIKPSNILLRSKQDGYEAVLTDFGVAKIQNAATALTGTGTIGTIDYMAPEQIMSAKEVTQRADIYALAIVLYEVITGQRPFAGSAGQVLFAHLQQPPPDPRDIDETIPRAVAHLVMRGMAKQPENRFQSAGEFAETFAAVLRGEPVIAASS